MNDPFRFLPELGGPRLLGLLSTPRLAALDPGQPDPDVLPALRDLTPEMLFTKPVAHPEAATACLAGLWLYFDYLEESHSLSQSLSTPEGSFWHAIMHRREPDAWNSKYWFRLVGDHPVFGQLREQTPTLGYVFTDALAFVDFVEQVRGTGSAEEETAKTVQRLEWGLLFDYCMQAAL
ncbi:MAG: hypothetical protein LC104_07275 [Bacteroidales bacterium]|nr:hypothetical protein [Bacteroidales bacterium]